MILSSEQWAHLIAIVGIGCTLGGTLAGVWITQTYQLKLARERMRNENRTRWHTEKRALYLRFYEAAHEALLVTQLNPIDKTMPLEDRGKSTQERVVAVNALLGLKKSISFVGEEGVRNAMEKVFSAFGEATRALSHGTAELQDEKCDAFYEELERAKVAMREELNPVA